MSKKRQSIGGFIHLNGGFTLIETIIYSFVLIVITISVITMLTSMSRSFFSFRQARNLKTAAFGVDRMVRDIRLAVDVDELESIFDANPGKLVLQMLDDSTVSFYVENGILKVEQDGEEANLFPNYIEVNSLIFRKISSGQSVAVRVELAFTETRGTPRQESLQALAVLRGTY